jgi:hypothetical protein
MFEMYEGDDAPSDAMISLNTNAGAEIEEGDERDTFDSLSEYLLPDSVFRAYSEDEILQRLQLWVDNDGYSMSAVLRLARNEIFARHGTDFVDASLDKYYYEERPNLYGSPYQIGKEAAKEFTDYERQNVKTIERIEEDYK